MVANSSSAFSSFLLGFSPGSVPAGNISDDKAIRIPPLQDLLINNTDPHPTMTTVYQKKHSQVCSPAILLNYRYTYDS